ncbi:DUF2461 family protein [Aquimarina sp. M1]
MPQNSSELRKLLDDNDYVQKFGGIKRRALKRIPKEWKEAYEREPLIANKQFYFVEEETTDLITSVNLIPKLMSYWKTMQPITDYLLQAKQ